MFKDLHVVTAKIENTDFAKLAMEEFPKYESHQCMVCVALNLPMHAILFFFFSKENLKFYARYSFSETLPSHFLFSLFWKNSERQMR